MSARRESRQDLRRRLRRGVMLLASVGLASGCAAVGPTFKTPAAPEAKAYADPRDPTAKEPVLTAEARGAGPWWRELGSPTLDEVMTRALGGNHTVAIALANLDKAREQVAKDHAALGPNAVGAASYQRDRINFAAFGFAGLPNPTINILSIGPSVSYDFDLAGGARRAAEASRAMADLQAHRADAAYLSLTGNVALNAIRIAALRAQLEAAEAIAADDQQINEAIRQAQGAGGRASSAVHGGELQLQRDIAQTTPLRAELDEARHTLSLLVGKSPGEWSPPDFALADFQPPASIPVALPSRLVRTRPDILVAEAQLHADTARIGVATARLYPDVRLTASLSQEGLFPGALTGYGGTAYTFGPQLLAPLYDGGALRADRRAAVAQARASLAQYEQTVSSAFTQVSDVLSALARDEQRLATLDRELASARVSLEEEKAAYKLGGAPLATVITADRTWRGAEFDHLEAQGQRLADIVALYGATAAQWRANGASSTAGLPHAH